MGVDPGLTVTGYAVVERRGPALVPLAYGAITTDAAAATPDRLLALRSRLADLLATHRPDAVAIERLFFNANVRTAISVGHAAGVALLAAAEAGVTVADHTPTEVKLAVVGVGNATKRQVQAMVAAMLGLDNPPRPPDAADACALAICHLNRARLQRAVAAGGRGPR